MNVFFTDVQRAIKFNQSFVVTKDVQDQWHVKTRSIWNRILWWKNEEYETRQISRIAKALSQELSKTERLPIKEALADTTIKTVRTFLRSINPQLLLTDRYIRSCSRQLLAAKLGINSKIFNFNPGFESFAFESHLERYLNGYQHILRVDPETHQISLMCEGTYQPWSEVNKKLQSWSFPEKNAEENPHLAWYYGQKGVQKKDLYAWHTLEPYKVVEPTWGNRYLFEYNTCCMPTFALTGDHSWLELKTPKGEVYSAGLYRPGKSHFFETFQFPLKAKKGFLMSPDVSIWWNIPVHRIAVEISEKQFEEIKASVEKDKKEEDRLHFQLFSGNCQEYVNEKAAIAGIKLNTSLFLLRNIVPIKWQHNYDKALSYLPKLIHKIFKYTATFFLNLTQLTLGAAVVDDQLKNKGVEIQPHFNRFTDLFDPKKLHLHPPRHVGLTLRKEVEEWRGSDEERRFALPEKFKFNL